MTFCLRPPTKESPFPISNWIHCQTLLTIQKFLIFSCNPPFLQLRLIRSTYIGMLSKQYSQVLDITAEEFKNLSVQHQNGSVLIRSPAEQLLDTQGNIYPYIRDTIQLDGPHSDVSVPVCEMGIGILSYCFLERLNLLLSGGL